MVADLFSPAAGVVLELASAAAVGSSMAGDIIVGAQAVYAWNSSNKL